MDERERPIHETTVINTGERRGGGAAIAAIALLVIVAVAAVLYFGGYLQRAADKTDIDINIEAPKVQLPEMHIDRGKSDDPATNSGK
jgi:hypothetical protein